MPPELPSLGTPTFSMHSHPPLNFLIHTSRVPTAPRRRRASARVSRRAWTAIRSLGWAPWLATALLVGQPPRGAAQPAAEPASNEAPAASFEELIAAGVQEYERHDWTAAQFHFEQAHRLRPSARTLRALGLTAQQQHRNAEAATLFARALRSQELPLSGSMREEIAAAYRTLDDSIARYRLVLDDDDLLLRVDGKIPLFDRAELLLDAGRHELVVEGPRGAQSTHIIDATAGQRSELRLSGQARAVAVPAPSAPSEPAPAEDKSEPLPLATPIATEDAGWSTRDKIAFGTALGGGAAFVVGVTFGILALTEDTASRKDCDLNECGPSGLEHRDAAFNRAKISTIGFVAAGALLATSLTLHLTDDDASERPSPSAHAKLDLHVSVGSQRTSLALGGRF